MLALFGILSRCHRKKYRGCAGGIVCRAFVAGALLVSVRERKDAVCTGDAYFGVDRGLAITTTLSGPNPFPY